MPRSAKAKAEMTQEELRLVEAREKGIPWLRGLWPAITESSSARSAGLRAIGPLTPIDGSQASRPSLGTRPIDGLSPYTLFHPAGLRRLPP